jgi:hypothetical protein
MAIELKPCAHCGAQAVVKKVMGYYTVHCDGERGCGAQGGIAHQRHNAIKTWNRRDGEAKAVEAERERILDRLYSAWERGDFALSIESMIAIIKGERT